MKTVLKAVAGALTVAVLVSGTAAASDRNGSDACKGPHDVETYRVEVVPLTQSVRRGDHALVAATVYRTTDGETAVAPADGVNVMVALFSDDFVRAAGSITDRDGRAVLEIRLGRRFPTGWADATARATRKPLEDIPCDPLQEAGTAHEERFLRVR